jgi:hypothetical protein
LIHALDSIVRTEATRLRSKLNEYYQTQGRNDRVIIEFRKGSYRPIFLEPERDLSPDSLPNWPKRSTDHAMKTGREASKFKFWLPLASVVLSACSAGIMVVGVSGKTSAATSEAAPGLHVSGFAACSKLLAGCQHDHIHQCRLMAFRRFGSRTWLRETRYKLLFGELPARYPRWSPRNDRIVFVLGVDMPPAFRSSLSIWSIPPLGGTPRKIIENGSYANWSPDGTRIVFERGDQIWTAKADGTDQSRVEGVPSGDLLLADRMPAFSPDGSHLVFFHSEAGPRGDFLDHFLPRRPTAPSDLRCFHGWLTNLGT